RVHALCLRLAGEPTEARELVQDTFIHAWEALPRFRGDSNLTTWLHRIAVNAMLERRRRDRRRMARVSLAEDEDEAETAPSGGAVDRGELVAPDGRGVEGTRALARGSDGAGRAGIVRCDECAGAAAGAARVRRAELSAQCGGAAPHARRAARFAGAVHGGDGG